MVLAAGLGTRLRPLTSDRAKAAVPFLGKPLLAGLLEHLHGQGVSRLVINTHYRPESVQRAVAAATLPGVDIHFSHEVSVLGTAGALGKAYHDGVLDPTEPVLVVNGKLHTTIDMKAVWAAHKHQGCPVTMLLRPNPQKAHFREVYVGDNRVRGFGPGRVPTGKDPLLFTGIHIVSPEIMAKMPTTDADTIRDIYPPLIEAGRVAVHVEPQGRWWEFSTPERYLALHLEAMRLGLCPPVVASSGAHSASDAKVTLSVLWENSEVEADAKVRRSVVGAGVRIRRGEVLENAVVVARHVADGDRQGIPWGDRIRFPLMDLT